MGDEADAPRLNPDEHLVDERGENDGAAGAKRLGDLAAAPHDNERL